MRGREVLLVIEDGTEYTDAFRRIAAATPSQVEFLRAADGEEARRLLSERVIGAVFLDMVFDRTPPGRLVGDLDHLITRFAGDRARALEHLARNQGFYLVHDLAPAIPAGVPVLLAYDFSSEPERLSLLREKLPSLTGLPDGMPISEVLDSLLGGDH